MRRSEVGNALKLSISDTGQGPPEDHQHRLGLATRIVPRGAGTPAGAGCWGGMPFEGLVRKKREQSHCDFGHAAAGLEPQEPGGLAGVLRTIFGGAM